MPDYREIFQNVRQGLHASFPHRQDSIADLLNALSSNDHARSVVALSLNPNYQRQYATLYRAIDAAYDTSLYPSCSLEARQQAEVLLQGLQTPTPPVYQVFALDETPYPRPYARCLADRQTIHRSTPIPGQRPISLGHSYSILAAVGTEAPQVGGRWALPLSLERVSSLRSTIATAHDQIEQLLSCPSAATLPLKVLTVDSRYPTPEFLAPLYECSDCLVVARVRRNRVFWLPPEPTTAVTRAPQFGARFALGDPATWPVPETETRVAIDPLKRPGHHWRLRVWHEVLMRGKRGLPMHNKPFSLLQVQAEDETGAAYGAPLWLLVWGQQRLRLSPEQLRQAYAERFNLEHFLGFAKAHLLFTQFETFDTPRELNWVRLSGLAYAQLYFARSLVTVLPLPSRLTYPVVKFYPSRKLCPCSKAAAAS